MTDKTLLRTNKIVTTDQVALIVAGVNLEEAFSPLTDSGSPNKVGSAVRNTLCENLRRGHFDPEPLSMAYVINGYYSPIGNTVFGINNIITALRMDISVVHASFYADSLWPWILKNVEELKATNPGLFDALTEIYPQDSDAKADNVDLPPSEIRLSLQVTALSEQLMALTTELQQVEKENALLKSKAPAFRHQTPLLKKADEVQDYFWGDNWDPNDPDTNPRQADIIEWLMKEPHSLARTRAYAVEFLACPVIRTGGR